MAAVRASAASRTDNTLLTPSLSNDERRESHISTLVSVSVESDPGYGNLISASSLHTTPITQR